MENLFNEYDKAIREKTDVAKDKVEEMKNRIENALKQIVKKGYLEKYSLR